MSRLKKTTIPVLILSAVLLFTASAGTEAADPAVVRVGAVTYPLSVGQFAVDPYADIAEVNDEELTEADKQEIIDSVITDLQFSFCTAFLKAEER